jgi:hypothetical protein
MGFLTRYLFCLDNQAYVTDFMAQSFSFVMRFGHYELIPHAIVSFLPQCPHLATRHIQFCRDALFASQIRSSVKSSTTQKKAPVLPPLVFVHTLKLHNNNIKEISGECLDFLPSLSAH